MTGPRFPTATRGPEGFPGQAVNPGAQALPYYSPFVGLMPEELIYKDKQWFTYNIPFLALPAAGTLTLSRTIQDNSMFFWQYLVAFVTSTDNQTVFDYPNWPFTVRFFEQSSGYDLSDGDTPVANICGNAIHPHVLPMPKILNGNTTVAATLLNLDTVNAYNVRFSLIGFKTFYGPNTQSVRVR